MAYRNIEDIEVGQSFDLDLRNIFEQAFHPDLAGTPEWSEFQMDYGTIEWISDGQYPGEGTYNGYDWKIEPFNRITTDTGILPLKVIEIDYNDEKIVCEVDDGSYGLPNVELSFDEVCMFGTFE